MYVCMYVYLYVRTGMCPIGLAWVEFAQLNWIEFISIELDWIGFHSIEFDCSGSNSIELFWIQFEVRQQDFNNLTNSLG